MERDTLEADEIHHCFGITRVSAGSGLSQGKA